MSKNVNILNNLLNEFNRSLISESTVDEVAMNPTAFAKSIEQAGEEQVLVGFEFEVCVPKKTIISKTTKQEKNPLGEIKEIFNEALTGSPGNFAPFDISAEYPFPAKDFDNYFKVKSDSGSKYSSVSECMDTELLPELVGDIKKVFNKLPEDIRASIIKNIKEQRNYNTMLRQAKSNIQKEFLFGYMFLGGLSDYIDMSSSAKLNAIKKATGVDVKKLWTNNARQINSYIIFGAIGYQRIFKMMFNVSSMGQFAKNIDQYFDFDPEAALKKLKRAMPDIIDDYSDDDDYDDDYDYFGASKILEPYVEKAFGSKVIVFDEYHEHRKNLTDWYIEPDGSLEPNLDDGAAEIVSPPLLAPNAIDALKKFYAMAKELKLYTSAENNTGLHINVSIPKDIDILKLAVFLGDQYVLTMFGRQDNEYAESVMKSVIQQLNKNKNDLVKTKKTRATKQFGVGGISSEIKMNALNSIVKNISREHTASISNNGKYISFRHAGGDYLNNFDTILNVVGRFVRCMIIASDPNLYRKEYLTKLVKLVNPVTTTQPQVIKGNLTQLKSIIYAIKTKGIPIINVHVCSTYNDDTSVAEVLSYSELEHYTGNEYYNFISANNFESLANYNRNLIPANNVAKQTIVNRLRNSELKKNVSRLPLSKFGTLPITINDEAFKNNKLNLKSVVNLMAPRNLPNTVKAIYVNKLRPYKIGLFTTTIEFIPPNDPLTKRVLSTLISYYLTMARVTTKKSGRAR